MSSNTSPNRPPQTSDFFDQARDELFSHILRCGVLKAAQEHQQEWFDDTMGYLADRYEYLSESELAKLRKLGEQYCRPVIARGGNQNASENERIGAAG